MIVVRTSPEVTIVVRAGEAPVIQNTIQEPVLIFEGSSSSVPGDIEEYEYVQSTPSALWIVNHNTGRGAFSVRLLTPGGVEMEAGVVEMSVNQLQISFTSPQTGKVIVI